MRPEDFKKKYTSLCNSMSKQEDNCVKITVGKTFWGFTKLNHIRDYGKFSGDAFTDHINLPDFQ